MFFLTRESSVNILQYKTIKSGSMLCLIYNIKAHKTKILLQNLKGIHFKYRQLVTAIFYLLFLKKDILRFALETR